MLPLRHRFLLRSYPRFFSLGYALSTQGVRVVCGRIEPEISQGTVVIPSKMHLSSVARNAVKRKVRAALKEVLPNFKNLVVVVVASKACQEKSVAELVSILQSLCQEAQTKQLSSIE